MPESPTNVIFKLYRNATKIISGHVSTERVDTVFLLNKQNRFRSNIDLIYVI